MAAASVGVKVPVWMPPSTTGGMVRAGMQAMTSRPILASPPNGCPGSTPIARARSTLSAIRQAANGRPGTTPAGNSAATETRPTKPQARNGIDGGIRMPSVPEVATSADGQGRG